ncbi:MAG: SDR family oxidoreductase [Anaerolineales bacterium]
MNKLENTTVLVTGGAVRIGRSIALAAAEEGANLVIQYNNSISEAETLQKDIEALGRKAVVYQADFASPQDCLRFAQKTFSEQKIDAVINHASIFADLSWDDTTLESWNDHLAVNLTAPYLISKEFALSFKGDRKGRIINLLDWRAFRPGPDHLPYTISKAGLAALTQSLAISLAPEITVNGIALGAILPPSDGGKVEDLVSSLPIPRWAELDEVSELLLFLLTGPTYITGEIIHLDGGRHLV